MCTGEGPGTPAMTGRTAWSVSDFPGTPKGLSQFDPNSRVWLGLTTFGKVTAKTFSDKVTLESHCVATLPSEALSADMGCFVLTCENPSSLLQEWFWPSEVCRITLVHWNRCWDAEERVCRFDCSVEFQLEFPAPGWCEGAAEGGWVASKRGGL